MSTLRQRQTASSTTPEKPAPDGPSDIRPAVPSSVIAKLLFFTLALVTVPLGTYFLTVKSIFKGNSTYAGALAAVMANVVLVGYLIVAIQEDQSDQKEEEEKRRNKKE
jgi:vacuolar ATPase assembly integral membrane protein VMA21